MKIFNVVWIGELGNRVTNLSSTFVTAVTRESIDGDNTRIVILIVKIIADVNDKFIYHSQVLSGSYYPLFLSIYPKLI